MDTILQQSVTSLLSSYFSFVVGVVAIVALTIFQPRSKPVRNVPPTNETSTEKIDRSKVCPNGSPGSGGKAKKKQSPEKWSPRDGGGVKQVEPEWLLTLGNHSGLSMDYKQQGKYVSPACNDDDPGGISASSSSSEANKENNSPGRLSRRQRKNRVRKDDSSPLKKKQRKDLRKKGSNEPSVLKQYLKLNMTEAEVFYVLRNYVLSPEDMMALGYPVESKLYPGRAMIFKAASLDANAKEFVPRDSEKGSEESLYSSLLVQNPTGNFHKKGEKCHEKELKKTDHSEERKCMRCGKNFFISPDGEYLTQEHCTYHWGKLQSPPSGGCDSFYTCCKARGGSRGCTSGKLHVWSGVEPGRNGPFDGYVRTRQRKSPPPDGNHGIYALDCEMCFTNTGLELTKISVVGLDGRPVYETFVKPESFIIDYNTRFSGITAKDMCRGKGVKTLRDVQNDLMGFVFADTILVGHGLENDLRALRMIHGTVVDTAVVFPHVLGLPYKRSLKSLAQTYLRKDIQIGAHDSYEDACSCLDLILWKLRKDLLRLSHSGEQRYLIS